MAEVYRIAQGCCGLAQNRRRHWNSG